MTYHLPFALMWVLGTSVAGVAEAAVTRSGPAQVVRLRPSSELRLASDAPDSAVALARDWGQFELQLPKKHFPVPAPNCRGNVRLRFIAIEPDAADRQARLDERWTLLQKLRRIEQGENAEAVIPLNLRHYVARTASGATALRYCNAFADGGR